MIEKINSVSISGLDVIGYADKRNLGCIPDFTAPIFRVRGTDMVLSPPYKIEDDIVLRPIVDHIDEFRSMVNCHEVTAFEAPFPALPDAAMWIDAELKVHYGPRESEGAAMKAARTPEQRKALEELRARKEQKA